MLTKGNRQLEGQASINGTVSVTKSQEKPENQLLKLLNPSELEYDKSKEHSVKENAVRRAIGQS